MRDNWWLEKRGETWCVVGYRADNSQWVRPASDTEIVLWDRWTHADHEIATLRLQLREAKDVYESNHG